MKVLSVGVFTHKGKSYPWRILESGTLQLFYEELSKWKDAFVIDPQCQCGQVPCPMCKGEIKGV